MFHRPSVSDRSDCLSGSGGAVNVRRRLGDRRTNSNRRNPCEVKERNTVYRPGCEILDLPSRP